MKKLFPILLLVLLTGCATQTFYLKENAKSYASVDNMQSFFLEGIGQSAEVDAAAVCGGADKVAKIEVEEDLVDGLISIFTYHIYTPRNARVFCTK